MREPALRSGAMRPKTFALAGILATGLVGSILDVVFENASGNVKPWVDFGPVVVALGFTFMWLHYDGLEVGFRRSALLNIGIVALGIVFIPVYLYRSRPSGRRAAMLLRFAGLCLLWIGASAVGYYGALAIV